MSTPANTDPTPLLSLDEGLALQRTDEDRFITTIAPEWDIFRGPNGGFLAALMLQAMVQRVGVATRRPRVLSVHYPAVPAAGPVEIRTRVVRSGRSVTWVNAELHAGGDLKVLASAALSEDWPSIEYADVKPPDLPEPFGLPGTLPEQPPYCAHFEYGSTGATPFTPKTHGFVGGYLRLRKPRPYDAMALTAFSDAWFPATFAHREHFTMAATLDLTLHFRNHGALAAVDPSAFLITTFTSRVASEGFFEEDGLLFAPDGTLVAQSRQLAIAKPLS